MKVITLEKHLEGSFVMSLEDVDNPGIPRLFTIQSDQKFIRLPIKFALDMLMKPHLEARLKEGTLKIKDTDKSAFNSIAAEYGFIDLDPKEVTDTYSTKNILAVFNGGERKAKKFVDSMTEDKYRTVLDAVKTDENVNRGNLKLLEEKLNVKIEYGDE